MAELQYKIDQVFALDIGTRTVIGIVGKVEDGQLEVYAQDMVEHTSRAMYDGQIHDIPKVAEAVAVIKARLEEKIGHQLDKVAIAAAGRSLKTKRCYVELSVNENVEIDGSMIHNLVFSGVREALAQLNQELGDQAKDVFYCVGHSVVQYYLDGFSIGNLIGHRGRMIGADILATFLPGSVVDSLYAVMERVGLEPVSLTLEPIAAMDIAVPEGVRLLNLALVDIGAGTSDIAVCKDGTIVAYGMVPVAGDEVTETIVEACLVDFNTAERIKREMKKDQDIVYADIIGLENVMPYQDLLQLIEPVVNRLADEIAANILALNGGQPPKSVFCVGGGSKVPLLTDKLAERLAILPQRVALRGISTIKNLRCSEQNLIDGPEGITVLGIATVAQANIGHDFLRVTINGQEHKVFNYQEISVAALLGLVEYNPRNLIGQNGRDLTYVFNGNRKKVFGQLGQPARILVNGQEANLKQVVKSGDAITVVDAVNGREARLVLAELLAARGLDRQRYQVKVNGREEPLNYLIKEMDKIETVPVEEVSPEVVPVGGSLEAPAKTGSESGIKVTVNNLEIVMSGNKQPLFVDIFNYVDFDVHKVKGNVVFKVNGEEALFTQYLQPGDRVEIICDPQVQIQRRNHVG